MTQNVHQVVIGCPPERVHLFVADLGTWRQWHGSPGQQAEKITSGPVDVGTVWRVSAPVQGQLITMTIEITDYEPDSRFAFRTTSGPIQAQQMFAFERVEDGTRLTTVLQLADPQLAQAARRQWDNDLLTLKKLLEAQG